MKLLTTILTLTATASAAALAAADTNNNDLPVARSAGDLGKRACYITCYPTRSYCTWAPYNYYCKNDGRFGWDRRNTDCEDLNRGCYCSCDWTAPGIGEIGEVAGGPAAAEAGQVEETAIEEKA
ncbi:hypothetical protein CPLU01_09334 [Colletotrichum plurivorum]|uniref:Uncharacterized protein n=1 Tax=Colletotrichum plurivorum TaxID=2175906 RepID=A0A8H6K908_9PEZI|nr:hypothetical protein CPLU01_09334 [Colletotrichum plurivorum]